MPTQHPAGPTLLNLIDWCAICEWGGVVAAEMTREGLMHPGVQNHPSLPDLRVFVQDRWGSAARLDGQRCRDLRDLLRARRRLTEEEANRFPLDHLAEALSAPASPPAGQASKPRKRTGRPVVGNPDKDAKLFDNWKTAKGQGSKQKDFAKAKGIPLSALQAALERERQRRNKSG